MLCPCESGLYFVECHGIDDERVDMTDEQLLVIDERIIEVIYEAYTDRE